MSISLILLLLSIILNGSGQSKAASYMLTLAMVFLAAMIGYQDMQIKKLERIVYGNETSNI